MISGITARYDLGSDAPLVGRISKNYALGAGAAASGAFSLMRDGAALLVDGTGGVAGDLVARYSPRLVAAPSADGYSYLLRPDACIAWTSETASIDGLAAALTRWFGTPK